MTNRQKGVRHRLERGTISVLGMPMDAYKRREKQPKDNAIVDCGWGRVLFGHTFSDNRLLAKAICEEKPGRRDIAFYIKDPHVVISFAPGRIFLDPSHTFRVWQHSYKSRGKAKKMRGFNVRLLNRKLDAERVSRLYTSIHAAPVAGTFLQGKNSRAITMFVAEDEKSGDIVGAVTGVDHGTAFNDQYNGSSLWALAVDPQTSYPGIGEMLVRTVTDHFFAKGRDYVDLSVLHSNTPAIQLYRKLGFKRVPIFTLKHKNAYNEPLFVASVPEENLNPYAAIIVKEARKRGISTKIMDAERGFFELSLGSRKVVCRESLCELTSAVSLQWCDDKRITNRILADAGLGVPDQITAGDIDACVTFMKEHGSVVVKPARGEQGAGITVNVRTKRDLARAIRAAGCVCESVLLETYVQGRDVRVLVINYEVVAVATRKPAEVTGNGTHTVKELIEKQSKRRQASSRGESRIPFDNETAKCIKEAGYVFDAVPPKGRKIQVRKTANFHTGGTIVDITDTISPKVCEQAVHAAKTLKIPVVGLDFIVPSRDGEKPVIIEANERPGLANHEPRPTAERFVDLLFPQTLR